MKGREARAAALSSDLSPAKPPTKKASHSSPPAHAFAISLYGLSLTLLSNAALKCGLAVFRSVDPVHVVPRYASYSPMSASAWAPIQLPP